MNYHTNLLRFVPKDKDIENLFDRLERHPVVYNVDGKMAQRISRSKTIRYLKKQNDIYIKNGVIALPDSVKLKKDVRNGFRFYF